MYSCETEFKSPFISEPKLTKNRRGGQEKTFDKREFLRRQAGKTGEEEED